MGEREELMGRFWKIFFVMGSGWWLIRAVNDRAAAARAKALARFLA
jgi:hypothetical protein